VSSHHAVTCWPSLTITLRPSRIEGNRLVEHRRVSISRDGDRIIVFTDFDLTVPGLQQSTNPIPGTAASSSLLDPGKAWTIVTQFFWRYKHQQGPSINPRCTSSPSRDVEHRIR